MPHPAVAPRPISPGHIEAAIDRYVAASCARLDRVVAQATLPEPTIKDAARAIDAIEPLIETLAGLAIGRVIGLAMQGLRRTFDREASARVEAAMARAARALAPPAVAPLFAVDAAPCRAFAGEVRQRLRRRIALAPRDVRTVIAAMASALEPHEGAAFVRLLALLAEDPLLADRFAPQVAIAWRCYVAVVEGATCEPSDPLWTRWLRAVRGEATPIAAPTREQLAAHGVIAQIG